MKSNHLAFVAAFVLAVIAQVGYAAFNANTVDARIKSIGAEKTVLYYFDKKEWKLIIQGISSGDPKWIEIYTRLDPSADGAASEELGEAIFDALPIVPFRVLPLFMPKYSPEQICNFTFEASIPKGGINRYLTRIEKSLSKAKTAEQKSIAKSCLSGIEKSRAMFKNDPNY